MSPRSTTADAHADDVRNLTIAEFCKVEHISKFSFYKMKKEGLAPQVLEIYNIKRITPEARAKWHAMLMRRQQQKAGKLEAQRRVKLAQQAGRIAAASPRHQSKRKVRNAERLTA